MPGNKKPRKAYNPRRYARTFQWWRIDDKERVSVMNTDFALWVHYGLEQLREGTIARDATNTFGAMLQLARKLVPKMNEADKLNDILQKAEGATTEVYLAVCEGKPYDKRYIPFIEEGMPYALEIVKHCSLKELHEAAQASQFEKLMIRRALNDEA